MLFQLVKVRLLKSTVLILACLIVVGDCSRKHEYLMKNNRRISILAENSNENTNGQQIAAQQAENCVCVFHYLCDRNYNLITNGDGVIDQRIGPNDPPTTQCPQPGQICCRVANGTVVPTSLPPVVSPTPAPGTTSAPATTAAVTTTMAPTTTTRQSGSTVGGNPSITLPPGTVIILPTQPVPTSAPPTAAATTPTPATIPTGQPTAPPTTAAATTPTAATIPTAPPTAAPTTAAPVTTATLATTRPPVPPTAAPATSAAPGQGSSTAASVTTAAPANPTTVRQIVIPTIPPPSTPTPPPMTIPTVRPPDFTTTDRQLVIPTFPPPLTPTPPPMTIPTVRPPDFTTTDRQTVTPTLPPPMTIPTVPPSTQPPIIFPNNTLTPPTTTPPPVVFPTTSPPTTPPPIVFPTTPSIIFPPTNQPGNVTIPSTSQPPVVFPTTSAPGTSAGTTMPPVVFPTTSGTVTTAPGTTAATGTTAAPATTTTTTARPVQPTPGPPGSQCGVRYVQPGRVETIEPSSTSYAEFPWMLAVLDSTAVTSDGTVVRNAFVAGASLITRNIALSGAHRLRNFTNNPTNLIVRAGEWNTVTANEPLPHQDRTVQRIEIHQDFNNRTLFNDIALLKLEEPVVFANNVVLICLPNINQQFTGSCVATGWGQNAFGPSGQFQRIMRKVTLPVVDRATCQARLRDTRLGFGFILDASFMCAGGQPNLDTCTGDGGGPLVCATPNGTYVQAGIVSWGIGCGMSNVPGVYIDVGVFREWINSSVNRLNIDTVPRFTANRK